MGAAVGMVCLPLEKAARKTAEAFAPAYTAYFDFVQRADRVPCRDFAVVLQQEKVLLSDKTSVKNPALGAGAAEPPS